MNSDSLKKSILQYEAQLANVLNSIQSENVSGRDDLCKLKTDLEQLIQVSKDYLAEISEPECESNTTDQNDVDDEYSTFMEKIWLRKRTGDIIPTKFKNAQNSEQKMERCNVSSSILKEVKSRLADTFDWLELIRHLQELRELRKSAAIRKGECATSLSEENFNKIMEDLKQIWEAKRGHYTCEEEHLNNLISSCQHNNNKMYLDHWKHALFGKSKMEIGKPSHVLNMEQFVSIRSSWDHYIISESDQSGSKIPVGYITSKANPSAFWKKYLSEPDRL